MSCNVDLVFYFWLEKFTLGLLELRIISEVSKSIIRPYTKPLRLNVTHCAIQALFERSGRFKLHNKEEEDALKLILL